jgi:hypothetical protein
MCSFTAGSFDDAFNTNTLDFTEFVWSLNPKTLYNCKQSNVGLDHIVITVEAE